MVTCQAGPSMGFFRQVYWSGLPFPSPGDLPDPGIEHVSSAWQMGSLPLNHQGNPWNTRDVQKLRKWSEILVVSPPHCWRHPNPFFPGVPLCLALISVCSSTCALSLKLHASFTIFASLRNAFFTGDNIYIYCLHIYIICIYTYIYVYTDGWQ